jgi:hypothetical protein
MEAIDLWRLLELAALAGLAGWASEVLIDTGLARGFSLLWGVLGVLFGGWVVEMTGWHAGPAVDGYPVIAAFAATLVVSLIVKGVSLGLAGSR